MKCAKCGFDNRSGARFCKRCGEVLQAQSTAPVMPTPTGLICPACGATNVKMDARYCQRCGKPLPGAAPEQPATQPSMPPLPSMPDHPPTQPAMSKSIPAPELATIPSPRLPPVPPPSKSRKGLPKWVMWVAVGFFALACIATLAVIAAFAIPPLLGGRAGLVPTGVATEVPAQTPGEVLVGTVTVTPTVTPTEGPTGVPKTLPEMSPQAAIAVALSASDLQTGDLLTVTVVITNTGELPFGGARCQLVTDGPLAPISPQVEPLQGLVGPGQAEMVTFVLEAADVGEASLRAAVTMEVPEAAPPLGGAVSERVTVTVSE